MLLWRSLTNFKYFQKMPCHCNILTAVKHLHSLCKVTICVQFFYHHLQGLVLPVCSTTKVQGRIDLFLKGLPFLLPLSANYFNLSLHLLPFIQSTFSWTHRVPVWFLGAWYSLLSYILQQPSGITFQLLQFHLPFVSVWPAMSLIL